MKSSAAEPAMTIGEIAGRFGLATHVLRHWEAMGLLTPTRTHSGGRRYRRDDLYRVAIILRAKEARFGLDQIREMIEAGDPAVRQTILRLQRAELVERIGRLQGALELVDCALGCDHDDIATCPHFQRFLDDRVGLGAGRPGS